jgi:hypothetical protein
MSQAPLPAGSTRTAFPPGMDPGTAFIAGGFELRTTQYT